jgi:hypothetical protein
MRSAEPTRANRKSGAWATRESVTERELKLASIARQMTNTGIVAAFKALAVIVAKVLGNIRVTVFIAIVYVRLAMVLVILACSYHAVLKPTPLRVVEL